MPEGKGYSGWTNYETWNVALWIDNDQGLQEMVIEMTNSVEDQRDLADQIKGIVEENNPLAGEASMYSDLLQAAIDSANYDEIAEHFWEDYREEKSEEEEEFVPEEE